MFIEDGAGNFVASSTQEFIHLHVRKSYNALNVLVKQIFFYIYVKFSKALFLKTFSLTRRNSLDVKHCLQTKSSENFCLYDV